MQERRRARFACVPCRQHKRRCCRTLPSCHLCVKVGRNCNYASSRRNTATVPHLSTALYSAELDSFTEAQLSTPLTGISLRNCFLDSVATRGRQAHRPALLWTSIVTDVEPLDAVQAHEILKKHSENVHCWLPIVSIRRLKRQLLLEESLTSADRVAMMYAMELVNDLHAIPSSKVAQAIRVALFACESAGILTLSYLTANILLAFCEVGHGWFPAAYSSLARCVRLCMSLGLHDKRKATQLLEKADSWTEVEERRRLWWAVLILDRVVHAGFRFRPLLYPSIPRDEIIPANDESWDRGEMAVNLFLVMSIEATTRVSFYARTCQAADLLGRVCLHANEHPNAQDANLHFQEAYQLSRTTTALLEMIEGDAEFSNTAEKLLSARALSYSALLLLYDVHSCIEVDEVESCGGDKGMRLEMQQLAIDGFRSLSSRVRGLAGEVIARLEQPGGQQISISPLVFNCIYAAAGIYAWYYRESGDESHLQPLQDLRSTLRRCSRYWQSASESKKS